MRFAILQKYNHDGNEKIVLEWDAELVASMLKSQINTNLMAGKKRFRNFTQDEVNKAIDGAFKDVISQFKKESVRL